MTPKNNNIPGSDSFKGAMFGFRLVEEPSTCVMSLSPETDGHEIRGDLGFKV